MNSPKLSVLESKMVLHMSTMVASKSKPFQKFGDEEHFESVGHEEGAGPEEIPLVVESH